MPDQLKELSVAVAILMGRRTAQAKFPLKFKGHTIRMHADAGGGYKAHVAQGNELLHTTKRHQDPAVAAASAKSWIEEKSPAREKAPTKKKKKGQVSMLPDPKSTAIGTPDQPTEDLRSSAIALQAKITLVQTQAQDYLDALANKLAAEQGMEPGQGMLGLQTEVARMQQELTEKLLGMPENFIKFADQTIYAKKQTAKLNDPAWSQMVEAAQSRGRGVMKRVATILDRISIIFQKMTASVKLEEFAPGELDEKGMQKITKKNQQNRDKINKFEGDRNMIAPRSQKYFLDKAGETGAGGIQTPGFQ